MYTVRWERLKKKIVFGGKSGSSVSHVARVLWAYGETKCINLCAVQGSGLVSSRGVLSACLRLVLSLEAGRMCRREEAPRRVWKQQVLVLGGGAHRRGENSKAQEKIPAVLMS